MYKDINVIQMRSALLSIMRERNCSLLEARLHLLDEIGDMLDEAGNSIKADVEAGKL